MRIARFFVNLMEDRHWNASVILMRTLLLLRCVASPAVDLTVFHSQGKPSLPPTFSVQGGKGTPLRSALLAASVVFLYCTSCFHYHFSRYSCFLLSRLGKKFSLLSLSMEHKILYSLRPP